MFSDLYWHVSHAVMHAHFRCRSYEFSWQGREADSGCGMRVRWGEAAGCPVRWDLFSYMDCEGRFPMELGLGFGVLCFIARNPPDFVTAAGRRL